MSITRPVEKALSLQTNQATRLAQVAQDTAILAAAPPKPSAYVEGLDLATATVKRVAQLQQSWARDWGAWGHYCWTVVGADTIPKVAERTNNMYLQAQTQMVSQANQLSELTENVIVSYAFWLHQQVEEAREGGPS
ncbi:hypothetical protein [Tropicibacter naphthalenivorans]|uniref:Uncharacterized protein n=1 Tax=Tropicibacter naphthalenivorans TaxID=441103 RepID=A0A0P1GW82_9RHOB|nr:hypothetical protein [Tropicibacter naphthalenivorans]CUH78282.1 hypothetical protein TRN7648_01894 [Tropicibacter naphthalenivorans]SMC78962.1 hypothetical protein SAMN04488093_10456 [Tropicibacter naphthalenivorans]